MTDHDMTDMIWQMMEAVACEEGVYSAAWWSAIRISRQQSAEDDKTREDDARLDGVAYGGSDEVEGGGISAEAIGVETRSVIGMEDAVVLMPEVVNVLAQDHVLHVRVSDDEGRAEWVASLYAAIEEEKNACFS